ncbi:MAG: hypothetical protein FWG89_04810 [Treponema sp.]|nr:hypothetical protein [Treponema sp.]
MLKKTVIQIFLLCVVFIIPLNAASISILVIEAGLSSSSPASSKSAMWENGLMDVFFESGHIVTNASISRLPDIPDEEEIPYLTEREFDEAKEGGMNFFLVAIVSHPSPHNVILRLFSTETSEMLLEYSYTDSTHRSDRAEYESIKENIMSFAAGIRQVIQ